VDGPSGTVTFLFTDIEGSSRLWETAPEAMRPALERHDAIVRSAIESHGGYVFATGGDGFAAAFDGAGEALAAALVA
jgi:class 3 adenylate cyclase